MIESLRIQGIAILDEASLEFGPGLNVLTGETGAGKSIVLGALSLLSGARAGAGLLREGVEKGEVEAVFHTAALEDLEVDLEARGFELDREVPHELVVHRSVARTGRSRARVMGQLVPVAMLSDVFSGRIEVSSQHSSQALLKTENHGLFLDSAGGLLKARNAVEQGYREVRALDAEIERLRRESEERVRQRDFLEFQLAELREVDLRPGELGELGSEHARLAHADRLREEGASAVRAISGDDTGSDAASALDRVAAAVRVLEGLLKMDPGLGEMVDRFRALDTELRDAASDLERYVDTVDMDPARLSQLDERLSQVERVRRKYGATEEEIFAYRDRIEAEFAAVEGDDARSESLERERADKLEALAHAAQKLSEGRKKAARKLRRQLEAELKELAMPNARIEVQLEPLAVATEDSGSEGAAALPCGPTGAENPEFRFSANSGEPLRSLQKVASGGELSRVFLALKNSLRRAASGMVLVFDEVDAGVGGRVAERIGRALSELSKEHQVLCITHLPQIAAFADVHFSVEKATAKGRTVARIRRLQGDDRVDEIARMAGGESVTDATREHARDLMRVRTA